MKKLVLAVAMAVGTLFAGAIGPANAAAVTGAAATSKSTAFIPGGVRADRSLVEIRGGRRGWRRGFRGGGPRWGHRPYRRRNHFGALIGGVVLGAIIAGAAANYRRPPRDDLCWYWTSPYRTHGYWDYCDVY